MNGFTPDQRRYRVHGRLFNVVEVFTSAAEANAYMVRNENVGVLAIDESGSFERIVLADIKDNGVPA